MPTALHDVKGGFFLRDRPEQPFYEDRLRNLHCSCAFSAVASAPFVCAFGYTTGAGAGGQKDTGLGES